MDKKLLDYIYSNWEFILKNNQHRGRVFIATIYSPKKDKIISSNVNSILLYKNPLYHAEITTLMEGFKRIDSLQFPPDTIMICSHEPCIMCTGALAWSGIKNVHYLFSYEETKCIFHVDGDIEINDELFGSAHFHPKNNFVNFHKINYREMKEKFIQLYYELGCNPRGEFI